MKIFQLGQDQNRQTAGYIDAGHKWGLPGVDCSACKSIWSTVGLEYPSVDLTGLPDERLYRMPRLEPLEIYLDLRKNIANAFPKLPLLAPGTQFGPSVGKAFGNLDGFVWRAWWTVCLESSALEDLKTSGLCLPRTVRAELKFKKEEREIFEFDLPLRGALANPVYDGIQLDYCTACGRNSATIPDEILIDRDSLPADLDIFRVRNFTTIILVTEKFVDAIKTYDIKGAVFEEVKVV